MSKTLEQRFWEKVDKSGRPDACWLWLAAIDSTGYGAVKHMGKKRNAHRVAYELTYGPIDRNMDIMHSCDVRLCCNPMHLSAGTRLENVQDCIKKGRHTKGENNGTAKLNEPMVRMIKLLARVGFSWYSIHRQTGLNKETVRDICNGTNWATVYPLPIAETPAPHLVP